MLTIKYINKNVQRYCTNPRLTQKDYGTQIAKKLNQRMCDLAALDNVDDLLNCGIDNPHLLNYDLSGRIGWDITNMIRLVIKVSDDFNIDTVKDLSKVTEVTIEGVRDYHGGNKQWLIS